MHVRQTEAQKHKNRWEAPASSQTPHCLIVKLRKNKTKKQQHRSGFENKLLLSSFWPLCFPSFYFSLYLFAPPKRPTRLCDHYCKSALTRCWLRFGGLVWNWLWPFLASCCRDGDRLVSSLFIVCANPISAALLWIPDHYYASGRSVPLCGGISHSEEASPERARDQGLRPARSQRWSPEPCRLLVTGWRQNTGFDSSGTY